MAYFHTVCSGEIIIESMAVVLPGVPRQTISSVYSKACCNQSAPVQYQQAQVVGKGCDEESSKVYV